MRDLKEQTAEMEPLVQRLDIKADIGKLYEIAKQVHLVNYKHTPAFRFESTMESRRHLYGVRSGMLIASRMQGGAYQGSTMVLSDQDEEQRIRTEFSVEAVDDYHEQYKARTPICIGYMNDVLDFFEKAGGCWRTTFWTETPGYGYVPHTDNPSDTAAIHIPIKTNTFCMMGYETGQVYHLPADGHCYWVSTHVRHTAWNHGSELRTHLRINLPRAHKEMYLNMKGEVIMDSDEIPFG